jgi:hypothetical protein
VRRARVPASIDVISMHPMNCAEAQTAAPVSAFSLIDFFAKRREFSQLRKLTYEARRRHWLFSG